MEFVEVDCRNGKRDVRGTVIVGWKTPWGFTSREMCHASPVKRFPKSIVVNRIGSGGVRNLTGRVGSGRVGSGRVGSGQAVSNFTVRSREK